MPNALCEKKLAILQEISDAIILTDNIHTLAHLMLDLAIGHIQAEKGSLMLLDPKNELYILCSRGIDENLAKNYRMPLGKGIAGIVAQNGEAVLVCDIDQDARFHHAARDRYRTRSFISCPIKGRDRLWGVLNINDKTNGQPFSEDEFALVQVIASQAAIALKQIFLINKHKAKASEIEEINRKLIDADVAKTEFLTRISHELRTPLNSIKGAVYYLQRSDDLSLDGRREFHQIISKETDKLVVFVEKQLDFLRLQDETRLVKKSVIQLRDILNDTLNSRLLQNVLGRKNLQLSINIEEGLSAIVGDKILVQQLFINFLEGVIPHLANGSLIQISATENAHIKLQFVTTCPLDSELFEDFFKSSGIQFTSRSEEHVKLYLALKAADLHGWQMQGENFEDRFVAEITIPKGTRQKIEAAVNASMDMALEFVAELLGVNTCSLMLSDDLTGDLSIVSARGLSDEIVKRTRIKLGDRIAGWVASEGTPLLIKNIEEDPRFSRKNLDQQYSSRSLLSVPLKVDDKVFGVLNLNNKKNGEIFTDTDFLIAKVITERVSSLIQSLQNDEISEDELTRLLNSLDNLLYAERRYSKKSSRYLDLMGRLVDALGLSSEEKQTAMYVAMVYDLGLTLVDHSLLEKSGPLSKLEKNTIRSHPLTTLDLLGDIEISEEVKKIILHHHEHFDGSGYPSGLKGKEIPLLSRILAVVDAYCAMTEDRAYRGAMQPVEVVNELLKLEAKVYDPQILKVLEKFI